MAVGDNRPYFKKKGDKESASNYRPVRFFLFLKASYYLRHASQHGFLPKRFFLSNPLVLEKRATALSDDKTAVDLVYLNFTKEFDSVNHRPQCRDMAYIHKFCPESKASRPKWHTLSQMGNRPLSSATSTSGVPQCSVIGPLLLSIGCMISLLL